MAACSFTVFLLKHCIVRVDGNHVKTGNEDLNIGVLMEGYNANPSLPVDNYISNLWSFQINLLPNFSLGWNSDLISSEK